MAVVATLASLGERFQGEEGNGKAAGLGGSGEPRGRAARAAGCNQAQKVDCVRSDFFQRAAQPLGGTYNAN